MRKPSGYWTKELCQIEANKYNTRKDFDTNSSGAYNAAVRYGWLEEICSNIPKKQTKPINYWTKEQCHIEAKKYKTRKEFCLMAKQPYTKALKNKWIDEICEHMFNQRYSSPQLILKDILSQLVNAKILYDDRITIKPKEIDIYFPEFKLGFEYNGQKWHETEIGIKRDNEKLIICKKKDILIITIKEYSLNYFKYEENIKKQLIDNLDTINKRTNLIITKEDILNVIVSDNAFDSIMDFNDIKKICDEYIDYQKFRENEANILHILKKYRKLKEYTSHMVRGKMGYKGYGDNKTLIKIEIDSIIYNSISEAARLLNLSFGIIKRKLQNEKYPNYKTIEK